MKLHVQMPMHSLVRAVYLFDYIGRLGLQLGFGRALLQPSVATPFRHAPAAPESHSALIGGRRASALRCSLPHRWWLQ